MGHSSPKEAEGTPPQPRQKYLCGSAQHDSQSMHLWRSELQEWQREQGVVPAQVSLEQCACWGRGDGFLEEWGAGGGQLGEPGLVSLHLIFIFVFSLVTSRETFPIYR